MYNIYHDYECYIQYIQLSKEVLLKYHLCIYVTQFWKMGLMAAITKIELW